MCPFTAARYVGSEAAQHTIIVPVNLRLKGQHVASFPAFGYQWLFATSRRSHTIPNSWPLVGFTDKLVVPFEPTTDERFIAWLKTKMTPELLN